MDDLARLADLADPAAPPPPAYLAAVRARRSARRLTIAACSLTAAAICAAAITILAPRGVTTPVPTPPLPKRVESATQPTPQPIAAARSAPPTLGHLMRQIRNLPPGSEIELPVPPGGGSVPATMLRPWRDPELLRELTGL